MDGAYSAWYDVTNDKNSEMFDGYKYQEFKMNRLCVRNSEKETTTFDNQIEKSDPQNIGRLVLEESQTRRFGGGHINMEDWGDNGTIYLAASLRQRKNGSHDEDNKAIIKLNAMSYVRVISNFASKSPQHVVFYESGEVKEAEDNTAMGYSILYLCMVIETIMFLFTYIKRVLQMAFLTMIAPLVAIMYPVDKLGDSKAQAFNTWFKDYLFNMLIQPMHLLLYTVFIVAAGELLSRNIIYGLAIYGFMIPAEKYFKKILGFEKSSTGGGGLMGGALGHGLAMDGLGKLAGIGPAGRGGKGGSADGNSKNKPRIKKKSAPDRSNIPSGSGASPEGSGRSLPESGGTTKSGGVSGAGKGSNMSGNINGNRKASKPSADGNGKKRPFLSGLKNGVKRRVRGALTGGENYSGRKGFAKDAGKFIGKKLGKTVGRTALRAGGIAILGGIGAGIGAASAMANGDVSHLFKGAAVGAGAGNKWGGYFYDKGANFVGGVADDMKYENIMNDDNAKDEFRREEALKNFDTDLSYMDTDQRKKYEEAINEAAPYIDFKSLDDVDAYIAAKDECDSWEDAVNLYKDAGAAYNIETNKGTFIGSELSNYRNGDGSDKFSREQISALVKAKNNGVDISNVNAMRDKVDEINSKSVDERTDWEKETLKVLDYFANDSAGIAKVSDIQRAEKWTESAIKIQNKRK